MRSLIVVLFITGACTGAPSFMFPGWERVSAADAAAYCAERGADIAPVPTTDREIAEASAACLLGDELFCWVGDSDAGGAHVLNAVDQVVVEVPADIGPAVPLCLAR